MKPEYNPEADPHPPETPDPAADPAEQARLRAEVDRVQAEIERHRQPPDAMTIQQAQERLAAEVDAAHSKASPADDLAPPDKYETRPCAACEQHHPEQCESPTSDETNVYACDGTITGEIAQPSRLRAVLKDIGEERDRQGELLAAGKIPWDCANPAVADGDKLAVLTGEVGEVAREILDKPVRVRRLTLRRELVQVAAVAAGWAESLEIDDEEVIG